jgi:hypothetical protein
VNKREDKLLNVCASMLCTAVVKELTFLVTGMHEAEIVHHCIMVCVTPTKQSALLL